MDAASTENWMDFMKKNNLTHCNWSINHKDEGASSPENPTGTLPSESCREL